MTRSEYYLMIYGPLKFGCGASSAETGLEGQEASLASILQGNYATRFASQQQMLGALNSSLTPTLQAGPNQTGFSAPELAAYNTQALNTTGANYANAARALSGQLAGRGGDSGLESGVDQQIKASLASQAAGTLSNEQLGITEANYAQGRQNYNTAVSGEMALAGEENPQSFASGASSANTGAFGEASQINQQNNQVAADLGGLAGGVISGIGAGIGGSSGVGAGLKTLGGFLG